MRRVLLALLLLVFSVSLFAQASGNKRRGKYLRTEVRGTEATEGYEVNIVESKTSFPQFVFKRILTLKLHEIRLYETVLETVTENRGEGITPRGTVDYVVIPGEIFEGEESDRIERRYDGVLKFALFTLNGKAYTTDENGIWTDDGQIVLSAFDEMRTKSIKLLFTHKEYGEATVNVTRNLIKREKIVTPGVEVQPEGDLLEALGMDFTQLKQSSDDGISIKVTCKEKAAPNETIAVTFEVRNNGMRSVSNLIGRSFSSVAGLDGKLFYFGMIAPGQTRSFSRLMTVSSGKGPCYCKVAFWNVHGAIKNIATDLCINVE